LYFWASLYERWFVILVFICLSKHHHVLGNIVFIFINIYTCMYLCIYVYMYTYIYIHIYTYAFFDWFTVFMRNFN
jgi:hypothetical protein